MSDFKNTVTDDVSDQTTMDQLIEGTIVEFNDDTITETGSHIFNGCKALTTVNLPLLSAIKQQTFTDCVSLTNVNVPEAIELDQYAFLRCTKLSQLDLPKMARFQGVNHFYACSSLKTVILRSPTMCTLANSNSFSSTPIAKGTGFVYVPKALLDTYKTATNWTTYARQLRAIEDWTDDGTVDGEISFTRKLITRTITEHVDDTTVKLLSYAFASCTSLTKVDLLVCTEMSSVPFQNCMALNTLILRASTCVKAFANVSANSSLANGTCYIYVPRALVDTYKSDSVWSTLAEQIRAIEDYPEITGGA